LSDDLKTIEPGGSVEEFLGEIIDRYRGMMFRAARSITRNDYDADDVIQKLCIRFVAGGIPDGLRENPPAYLIGCIVNEAKTVHRTRERRRIDDDTDLRVRDHECAAGRGDRAARSGSGRTGVVEDEVAGLVAAARSRAARACQGADDAGGDQAQGG